MDKNRESQWAVILERLYNITRSDLLSSQSQSFFLIHLSTISNFYSASVKHPAGITTWRWTVSGEFTSSSAYHMMHDKGVVCHFYRILWKIKAPSKVRVFIWLLVRNKILTQQVLAKRGIHAVPHCVLCNQDILEDRNHIFWICTFARQFWRALSPQLGTLTTSPTITRAWWQRRTTVQDAQKGLWDKLWAVAVWALWRERNRRTFSQERREISTLINETRIHIKLWSSLL